MKRRAFCSHLALTPLAAALSVFVPLAACSRQGDWPEGMMPMQWDRDTCSRCSMVISDRRFAAQIRGGASQQAFKFDDVGCLIVWLREKSEQFSWMRESATHMWVADASSNGERWIDPRKAHYQGGRKSPMGYNYAAMPHPQAGSVDFATAQEHIFARGRA